MTIRMNTVQKNVLMHASIFGLILLSVYQYLKVGSFGGD